MRKVYNQEVGHLLRAIRQREVDLGVPPVMPREWAEMENRCHAAIALALLHLEFSVSVFGGFLFYELMTLRRNLQHDKVNFQRRDICPRLEEFMRSSPDRLAFAARNGMRKYGLSVLWKRGNISTCQRPAKLFYLIMGQNTVQRAVSCCFHEHCIKISPCFRSYDGGNGARASRDCVILRLVV